MKVVPMGKYVLIRPDRPAEEKTSGGIVIPEMAKRNGDLGTGIVEAVGGMVEYDIHPGDRVRFRRVQMSGDRPTDDTFLTLQENVLCVEAADG